MVVRGILLLCLGLASALPARAEVIYQSLGDEPFFALTPRTWTLDLNGDGINDLTFAVDTGSYFQVTPAEGVEVAGWKYPPPDFGSLAFAFDLGAEIGDSLNEGLTWNTRVSTLQASALFGETTFYVGYWGGATDYLGVRVADEDGWHYAWIRIEAPFIGANGGFFKDFAFETEAGVAITTAVIPEPATIGMTLAALAFACALVGRHVRRKPCP